MSIEGNPENTDGEAMGTSAERQLDVLCGRRVEAIRADGTVDRYVYFPGSFLVLAVLDENNAPKELYTRGPDLSGTLSAAGGIGGILACTYSSGPVLFHHADLLGNVIALTDASATLVSTSRYTSFGEIIALSNGIVPRHLFSSKEMDRDVFLLYYGCRYYCPKLGRWLIRDLLEEKSAVVLYSFISNNPQGAFDALGLQEVTIRGDFYRKYAIVDFDVVQDSCQYGGGVYIENLRFVNNPDQMSYDLTDFMEEVGFGISKTGLSVGMLDIEYELVSKTISTEKKPCVYYSGLPLDGNKIIIKIRITGISHVKWGHFLGGALYSEEIENSTIVTIEGCCCSNTE